MVTINKNTNTKENKEENMEINNKPDRLSIRHRLKTIKYYVDYLYETYKPLKNPSGEYYYNGLVYITDEVEHFMDSPEELKVVEEMGIEIVGFLQLLRIQMGRFSGYGIQVNNNDIKKALSNIEIDYKIDRARLMYLYERLKEKGIIFLIYDSKGNEYATTVQQLFNWEYKMFERVLNKNAKKKQRRKEKSETVDYTEEDFVPVEEEPSCEPFDISTVENLDEKFVPIEKLLADSQNIIGQEQLNSFESEEIPPCEPLDMSIVEYLDEEVASTEKLSDDSQNIVDQELLNFFGSEDFPSCEPFDISTVGNLDRILVQHLDSKLDDADLDMLEEYDTYDTIDIDRINVSDIDDF